MDDGDFREYEEMKNAYRGDGHSRSTPPEPVCLQLSDWLARDIPEPDFIMGELLSTTSRIEVVAPTGLGKTNFCMAIAIHAAAGESFLHWQAARPARVLYIDGEMSRRLLRKRLSDAVRRLGRRPETFFILSRDDAEGMAPLNTPDGQSYVERVIDQLGGVDFIFFDNVMSLISGDMREEEGWSLTLPWVKSLTRREIGTLWVHHTGHNEDRGYGTSTREWQLDTVILMERAEAGQADLAFKLSFPKSRERAPHNRHDFEPATVKLENDQWNAQGVSMGVPLKKLTDRENSLLQQLRNTLAEEGCPAPDAVNFPPGVSVVSVESWRTRVFQAGIYEAKQGSRSIWSRERGRLIDKNKVRIWGDFAWIV